MQVGFLVEAWLREYSEPYYGMGSLRTYEKDRNLK